MLDLLYVVCSTRRSAVYRNISKLIGISVAILLCCSMGFPQSTSPGLDNASQLNVTTFTSTSAAFHDPFHLVVNNGYAFVTDSMDSVIRKIALTNGSVTTLAGQAGVFGSIDGIGPAARFGLPAGAWADSNFIYVTDAYFDVVRRVSSLSGDVTTLAGSSTAAPGSADGTGSDARFESPLGIWGDGTNLYVCDSLNFTVRKIVIATGAVTTLAGSARMRGTADGVGAAARFYGPAGIWGDGVNLYVTDGSGIRKVTIATGAVTTLSGASAVPGYLDATASQARLSFVSGIWGDNVNLFVADTGNSVIRKVSLQSGAVATVAGLASTVGNADGLGQIARFDDPTGIAGDGSALYVLDRTNVSLRMAVAPPTPPTNPGSGSTNPPSGTSPSGGGTSGGGTSGGGTSGGGTSGGGTSGGGTSGGGTSGGGTSGGGTSGSAPAGGGSGPGTPITTNSGNNVPSSAAPETADNQLRFDLQNRAWTSQTTSGNGDGIQTGYARIKTTTGTAAPAGMAIFGYRRDGILVSEATVPISKWIRSGRLPAQVDGVVNTGLAIANPNREAVTVNFYFTNASGLPMYSGSFVIPGGGLNSAFLDQSPFAPPSSLGIDLKKARTVSFAASAPIGVTGIRGFINERSDFLFTTLPVAPVTTTDSQPIVFAHFAQGGGWKTDLVLVNPTENNVSGAAYFFIPGSQATGGNRQQVQRYSMPPRGSITLQPSSSGELLVGWIQVVPDSDSNTPSGLSIFSFQTNGITVTQAAVEAIPKDSAFQLYVEASGDFRNGKPGSVQSGFALSNPSDGTAALNLELFALDGTPTGSRVSMLVSPNDHLAMFLNQLPLFAGRTVPFKGFLRVSGSPVTLVGLRGRYNERGDFLITTTTPTAESAPEALGESVFPYFADGGGYTTQFILNSAASQVANGSVVFVNPAGEPLPLPVRVDQ